MLWLILLTNCKTLEDIFSGISVLLNISNHKFVQFFEHDNVDNNKPRTAKVGAISKAQNCKRGDSLGFVKLQLVAKYEKKMN